MIMVILIPFSPPPPIPYVHFVMTLTFAMQNNRIHSALAFLHVLKGNFDRLFP